MGASFLITLREGLEIALVLAILAGYLVKTGRSHDLAAMWKGTFAALGLCLIFGVAIHKTHASAALLELAEFL